MTSAISILTFGNYGLIEAGLYFFFFFNSIEAGLYFFFMSIEAEK